MKEKKSDLLFIICFMCICLMPLVLMPIFGNQKPVGNEMEPAKPELNVNVLPDAGEYFSKKFAFRQELVNAGDLIKGKVFGVSAQSGVIMGKKGWLFYSNTLEDFQGVATLDDYRIASSAYNLSLIQQRLEDRGKKFAFTIAPNKNSLYPQFMRSGFRQNENTKNKIRLIAKMKESGVNYIDLYKLFEDQKEVLYHKTDSHWNNKGAAMVSRHLKEETGHEYTDWSGEKSEKRYDFQGDLAAMIYPLSRDNDKEFYYERDFTFKYVGESAGVKKDVTDKSIVETENDSKEGNLVMLRDSFGISLVPFMAEDYKKGYFINKAPYWIEPAISRDADQVIFELVERNLVNLTTDAPELDMGRVKMDTEDIPVDEDYKGTAKAEMSTSGNEFTKVYGNLDPAKTGEDTELWIIIRSADGDDYITPAFRTTRFGAKDNDKKKYGYSTYISWESLSPGDYEIYLIYGQEKELKRTEALGKVTI